MWEALLAGAIPVVLQTQAMKPFSKLPILFVEDFSRVTKELLEATLEKYPAPPAVHPVMTSEFWSAKIREARAELAGNPVMGWRNWIGESLSYGLGLLGRRWKLRA